MTANLFALQMCSTPNVETNFEEVERQLERIPKEEGLVVLPECFACFGGSDKEQHQIAERIGQGDAQKRLSKLALRFNKWIVAGSFPILPQGNMAVNKACKFFAASLVFNAQGEQVSRYNKVHLFDVSVSDSTGEYKESSSTLAGDSIAVFDSPWGKVGQLICYDLRFPALTEAMQEIDVLVVPSAFTAKTGKAHWHHLLAARSIEKQCYVVAANQGGTHKNGRETYGNSCVYSPWGELLDKVESGTAFAKACFDADLIKRIRRSMPVYEHRDASKTLKYT